MVDFQSRDTRRGLEDEEDESEAESETDGEPADGGTADQSEAADEPADESETDDGERGHEHDDSHDGQNDPGRDDSQTRGERGHDTRDHDGHDHDGHDHHAHDLDALGVAVVTVSSSRTLSDDPAGDTITATMEADDDEVVTRELIPDDYDRIQETLDNLVGRKDVDVIVTTGGTGVTPDDVTIEAARRLFDKELPGFGELFRLLSYDEIGTKVVGTRATAGIVNCVPVFCLPGSENAAHLGAETIISEEAAHIAGLAKRSDSS